MFAAGLFLSATLSPGPAHATVTCDTSWQRGTLQDDGGWDDDLAWDDDPAGTDYRVVCTGDAEGDTLDPR